MVDNKPKHTCSGCELCASLCPNKAISFVMDEDGFRYPTINKDKCTECNICSINCANQNIEAYRKNVHNTYGAYINDPIKLKESASGGVATALAEFILSQNGIVYGVSYTKNFKSAHYVRIDNANDTVQLKGSKYFHAEKSTVYERVCNDIRQNSKVLFIGLPCEVIALQKYMDLKKITSDGLLITCSLICHGVTSSMIHKLFIEKLEKQYKSKITAYTTKEKRRNWRDPYIYAQFANRRHYIYRLKDSIFGFYFKFFCRPSCYNCNCKGGIADLAIGDYWGGQKHAKFNSYGTSLIITNSNNGEALVRELKNVTLFRVPAAEAIEANRSFLNPLKRDDNIWYKLSGQINSDDWIKAYHSTLGSVQILKQKLCNLIPYCVFYAIKKVYYLIIDK